MGLIAVIGPSGSGKSSAVRELVRRGATRVHPTWTTRSRRADEMGECLEHRFVSDWEFDELDAGGFFLRTVTMFGLPWRYGLPPVDPSRDGRIDIVMLRAPLVALAQSLLPIEVVVQVEDDPSRIMARLLARGTSPDDVDARLEDNRREVALGRTLAAVVVSNNGSIEDLADRIVAHATPALVGMIDR